MTGPLHASGNPSPILPDDTRIYALGDIHGRADLLEDAFGRIDRHLDENPVHLSVDVLLGDYIDRGSRSREVIDLILARKATRRLIALTGNHEDMILHFLRKPHTFDFWVDKGGYETLASYGLHLRARLEPRDHLTIRASLLRMIPQNHLAFLANLPAYTKLGNCLFVHAGVRPGVPLETQKRHDLLWIRDAFLDSSEDFGAIVIHGHTPVMEPDIRPNRINIDTGAYATNRLTCLVLERATIAFI